MLLSFLHEGSPNDMLRRNRADQQRLSIKWAAKKRQQQGKGEKHQRDQLKQKEQIQRQQDRDQDAQQRKRTQRRSRLAAARQSKQIEKLTTLLDRALGIENNELVSPD